MATEHPMDKPVQMQAGSNNGPNVELEADEPLAFDEDDDFCLADTLVGMSDEEIERMAEHDAESEVASSALSGIPLDKATLRTGLIESYQKLRAERTARQSASPSTAEAGAPLAPRPYHDPVVTFDVVHDCYQHVWGGYLSLARHFEAAGDAEQAALYDEKFHHFNRVEMELWKLGDEEMWRQKTEVLPPLIKEMHAVRMQFLGY